MSDETDQTEARSSASVTISLELLWNVKRLLLLTIDDFRPENVMVQGRNWATSYGHAGYILAATSVEAFVNELFFGMAPMLGAQYPVSELGLEAELERLDLRTKLTLLPTVAAMAPLSRGAQPYQDMAILVRIRNDLAHYKMDGRIPSYVLGLQQRRIALTFPAGSLYAWPSAISTTEGMRWAHDTACGVVRALVERLPSDNPLRGYGESVKPIPDGWIAEQLRARRGIELQ